MAIEMKLLDNPEAFPVSGRIACQGIKGIFIFCGSENVSAGKEIFFKTFDAVLRQLRAECATTGLCPLKTIPMVP